MTYDFRSGAVHEPDTSIFQFPREGIQHHRYRVVNPQGENLGDVKEIVIDPRTGKVAYAVVSFGGFLGIGEKLFAIPFSSFAYNVEENEYVLDVPRSA